MKGCCGVSEVEEREVAASGVFARGREEGCLREGVRERERAREGVGDWCLREGEEREVAAFQR